MNRAEKSGTLVYRKICKAQFLQMNNIIGFIRICEQELTISLGGVFYLKVNNRSHYSGSA